MKKNKGFTMIELMIVMIILGIVTTIAILGIQGVLKRAKESYLDNQNKMVVLAGKTYYQDHRSKLPKRIGQKSEVTLQTLIDLQYIDPVKDEKGNDCIISESGKESKVYVQKISREEYQYNGYLFCSGKESGINDQTPPIVTLTPIKTETPSKKPLTVTLKAEDENGVLSYRYVIYKDGKEYKDSGYKNYKKKVAIKLDDNGKYKIIGYAYDKLGNQGKSQEGIYEINNLKPNCNNLTVIANPNTTNWQNRNVQLNVKITDSSIKYWTIKDRYFDNASKKTTLNILEKNTTLKTREYTLNQNGQHSIQVQGYNNIGESCTKEINTYKIDHEKPSKPTIINPTNGNKTNENFSLTVSTVENYSGVASWQYSYDQVNWITYDNSQSSTFVTTPFSAERNQDVYIRVIDNVGNVSEVASTHIWIDKTPPITVTGNIGRWQCGKCKSADSGTGAQVVRDGVIGNTLGRVIATISGTTVIFDYEILQGSKTWVGNSYYVEFKINNGTTDVYKQLIKQTGETWGTGSTHTGRISYSFSQKGTYKIYITSNTVTPYFNMDFGTITVY